MKCLRLGFAGLLASLALLLAGCDGSATSRDGSVVPARAAVSADTAATPAGSRVTATRYALANQCVVLRSAGGGGYVASAGTGYAATALTVAAGERFYMKPAALGQYLLYNRAGQVMSAAAPVVSTGLDNATDAAVFRLNVAGDRTSYPPAPVFDQEPTPAVIAAYRGFSDPGVQAATFTLTSDVDGRRLVVGTDNILTLADASNSSAERFVFITAKGCAAFPEAQSNTTGEAYRAVLPRGRALGMADVHVHISATSFLGGAQFGSPFSKFGVTRAVGSCAAEHGPLGERDAVGGLFTMDTDGHDTNGWPTFPDWPSRDNLTHDAIYWKWLERAWKGGLRVVVNDLVDNETLCELQRSLSSSPLQDCNEMNNAASQVGSMYAMQDYIDAQYGGRGAGWFRIVLTPAEARGVIAEGKLAVVLGIEVSNVLNCKLNYNPLRAQQPFQETGEGGLENNYSCSMTETGADNEIKTQISRLHELGVRQIITIHEFDNPFGGNGIFNDLILNLGNRENSGGIPSGTLAAPFEPDPETPTGEFWTTYDCPTESQPGFSGYLFGDSGGTTLMNAGAPPPLCLFLGQNGRPGGTTACYPAAPQCNARWLTPMGLYTYSKLMEFGLIFDVDHLEMAMKTQALELAEAQTPAYPFVSTHGTFGGMSNDQARRILRNGGFIYPSLGNAPQHLKLMEEMRAVWVSAGSPGLFAFGFGTDTNGLSAQAAPRASIAAGREVVYPFTLFDGPLFAELPEFDAVAGVQFEQPEERDAAGQGRSWSLDQDGSAHYGMLADFVQELRLEGRPWQMRALFNSAEQYIRTWERTEAASAAIRAKGIVIPPGVLRAAPVPGAVLTTSPVP